METLYIVALVLFFFWLFSVLREKARKEWEDKIVFTESKVAKCDGCGGYLYNIVDINLCLSEHGIWISYCCLEKKCPNFGRVARAYTSLVNFMPHIPLYWTDERVVIINDPRIKII
jgi:hypothetical protein